MFDLLSVVVLSWFEQPESKHTGPPALCLALLENTAQLPDRVLAQAILVNFVKESQHITDIRELREIVLYTLFFPVVL